MALFDKTIGLRDLRDRVAKQLQCSEDDAWAILSRKLRRGEIMARCEWAYSAAEHGKLIWPDEIGRETWVLVQEIDWRRDAFNVLSNQAPQLKYAQAVFFVLSELDFLEETHDPAEIKREARHSRRTGSAPVKNPSIKEKALAALYAGRDLLSEKHEVLTNDFGEGASRTTVMKAVREAVSEFNADKALTNTDTNTDAH